jgi:hypothetical protein
MLANVQRIIRQIINTEISLYMSVQLKINIKY